MCLVVDGRLTGWLLYFSTADPRTVENCCLPPQDRLFAVVVVFIFPLRRPCRRLITSSTVRRHNRRSVRI